MLILVPVLVLLGYAHTLPYELQFDDHLSIGDNAALDRPGDLEGIWHHRPSRFILYLSFALNVALTGRSPAGLRLVNLAIHLAASLLVGWIAATLSARLASRSEPSAPAAPPGAVGLVAGALFAIHPIATQAVTYLIQRTTSLAALWELTAVALYLRARAGGGTWTWAGSWVAAWLAALTKEMAVALPLLILMLEWTLGPSLDEPRVGAPGAPVLRSRLRRAVWLAPYLLVWPLVAITARLPSVETGVPVAGLRETVDVGRLAYGLTQLVVVPQYLRMVIWPAGQSVDHDVAVRQSPDGAVILGAAVLALLTFVAWRFRRREPLVCLGWAWFVTALLPESSVFPITDVMFEHRVYLPMAGIAWGAGSLLARFATARSRRWLVPAALLLALTTLTHVRNRAWKDEVSLWTDASAKAPRKPRARNNLGIAFEKRGRIEDAERAYAQVLELDPENIKGLLNLGRVEGMRGRYRGALTLQQRAARLEPDAPDVLTDLGTTWWALGDTARAAASYSRAIEVAGPMIGVSPRGLQVARHAAMNLARLRAAPQSAADSGSAVAPDSATAP